MNFIYLAWRKRIQSDWSTWRWQSAQRKWHQICREIERIFQGQRMARQGLTSRQWYFLQHEKIPDLRIWSSQKIRAAQTANFLKDQAAHIEYWKVLDEIDAVSMEFVILGNGFKIWKGICEGLTYEDFEIRYPKRWFKFHIYHWKKWKISIINNLFFLSQPNHPKICKKM
jgi:hypothetical protein